MITLGYPPGGLGENPDAQNTFEKEMVTESAPGGDRPSLILIKRPRDTNNHSNV